jgi:hypothetical protein
MLYFIIGLVVILFLFALIPIDKKETTKSNYTALTELINKKNIDIQQKYISNDKSNALILDKNNSLHIFYSKYRKKSDRSFVYGYSKFASHQIIESEIVIDNQSVYTTNRTSQLTGMAIGGILGVGGMIIGGLSGKKNINEMIKSINLKITVEDLDKPINKIVFLSNQKGIPKDSSEFRVAINNVEKWNGILEVLMRKQNNLSN